jgi:hypothetical protein
MLVDRDKAIEACAKAIQNLLTGHGNRKGGSDAADSARRVCIEVIRQLTLEDCRVEICPAPHEGHNEPCYYCGEKCNGFAGDPSKWPIPLCHVDDPGRVKWHHIGCVDERLHQVESLSARVAELQHDITRQMDVATEHVNRAEAAEAQVAELRKDAERYQWLRTDRHILMGMAFYSNEELDANIDAAIRRKGVWE